MKRLIGENINLRWKPEKGLWPVRIDPTQIDQIMANLCVNARDAIESVGNLTIETKNVLIEDSCRASHAEFECSHYVMLSVSDDGRGIGKEDLEHIFEPFFTTKDVGEGTGMGLATVYGIVKQNKGVVNVESEVGKGTTFRIYFPKSRGKSESNTNEGKQRPEKGRGETVLIVEDEPSVLAMSQEMLEKLGYFALTARTPGEALQKAQESGGKISLLVTDVIMPEMNGRELAEKLLDSHPELKVLYMSGYTANVIAQPGVTDEEICFIQKPFTFKDFAEKVRAALDHE